MDRWLRGLRNPLFNRNACSILVFAHKEGQDSGQGRKWSYAGFPTFSQMKRVGFGGYPRCRFAMQG